MKQTKQQLRTHISFSELKIWNECPFKHKLVYLEKVKEFKGNEHTAFGTAMHYVCENMFDQDSDLEAMFDSKFIEELTLLKEVDYELNTSLVVSMRNQGKHMLSFILPHLKKTFPSFEVVSVEESLMEPLEKDLSFKGYIDLVIKTPDDKYHVIDWKTCSWGWDTKRKTDRMTTYQLTLYKHFFAKKHSIDPKQIETHFALLKRTAKKNNVEIFRVTSGPKKIDNALKLLNKAVYNIKNKIFIKNRVSCTEGYGCEFNNTKFCTR
jgi:ATP-dependent exoDNAse (exonuclease V) beta subunit